MNVSSMSSCGSVKNTPLLLNQEPVSLPAPPDAGSIPQKAEIPLLGTPTGTTETNQVQDNSAIRLWHPSTVPPSNPPPARHDHNPPPDESKMKKLGPLLAVIAIAVTLAVNAPETVEPNLLFPYNAYIVLLGVSLCISFGLCTCSLVRRTPSPEFDVIQRRMLIIAIGCVLTTVILRLVMVLSLTSMGYVDALSFLAIISTVLLYIWYSWRNATNLRQTTAAPSEIPLGTIAADDQV